MNRRTNTDDAGTQPLHWREWLARINDGLKHMPPDIQAAMLREPTSIPLAQVMVLADRAARFEHLVNVAYAVQRNLNALPPEQLTVDELWAALGGFLKAFNSTLQGADGQERVPPPAFISIAESEIANLQRGIPSKRFRLDGDTLGDNPHETQTLVFKATAAVFLRLLMDRDKSRKQKYLAEIVAEAVNAGGFRGGHVGQAGEGRQKDKIDRGVTGRTVIEWLRTAERGEAVFSGAYKKSLASYRERCKPEHIERELAQLTQTIGAMSFLSRNRVDP